MCKLHQISETYHITFTKKQYCYLFTLCCFVEIKMLRHKLCRSTRNWWKAHCMRRYHQQATLKTTSATLWRTASCTSRTPLTTCVTPRDDHNICVLLFHYCVIYYGVIHRRGLHTILSWPVIRSTTRRRHLITRPLMKRRMMTAKR